MFYNIFDWMIMDQLNKLLYIKCTFGSTVDTSRNTWELESGEVACNTA